MKAIVDMVALAQAQFVSGDLRLVVCGVRM